MAKLKLPKIKDKWMDDIRTLPKVEVTWTDATIFDGWRRADDIDRAGIDVITLGWFLPPTKTEIKLGYSVTDDGKINELFIIPRAWVKKVRVLR